MTREKSIELLNKAVSDELLAVDQYMYFHFICDDRGYDPLAAIFKRLAIVEMTHVEMLAERILFLKGDVIMRRHAAVKQLHDVEEMLKCALALEDSSVNEYNAFAKECAKLEDSASKSLFEKLIIVEEEHYDIFDTELDNMKKFGDNYLALQAIDRSKESGTRSPTT